MADRLVIKEIVTSTGAPWLPNAPNASIEETSTGLRSGEDDYNASVTALTRGIRQDADTSYFNAFVVLPPIPRLMDTRAKEGAIAVEDAGLDLRADVIFSLQDFTTRTGLTVVALNVFTAEDGTYRLGIRVRITTNRGKS